MNRSAIITTVKRLTDSLTWFISDQIKFKTPIHQICVNLIIQFNIISFSHRITAIDAIITIITINAHVNLNDINRREIIE